MEDRSKPMAVTFSNIKVGEHFTFDNDIFIKTDTTIAWEVRNGKKYKEWAFRHNDLCSPVTLT